MAAAIDEGFGITLTGATSGFTGNLQNVNWNGVERNALATTYSETANGEATFQASDIIDYGTWEVDGQFKPDNLASIPVADAAETWTLTFPTASGQSTPVDVDATAFATSFSMSGPHDGMMTFSESLKISGGITVTAST